MRSEGQIYLIVSQCHFRLARVTTWIYWRLAIIHVNVMICIHKSRNKLLNKLWNHSTVLCINFPWHKYQLHLKIEVIIAVSNLAIWWNDQSQLFLAVIYALHKVVWAVVECFFNSQIYDNSFWSYIVYLLYIFFFQFNWHKNYFEIIAAVNKLKATKN